LRSGPLERAVSRWLVTGWLTWRPLIPTGWRWMPQARAADHRIRAGMNSVEAREARPEQL